MNFFYMNMMCSARTWTLALDEITLVSFDSISSPNLNKIIWMLKAPLKIFFLWYIRTGMILTKDTLEKCNWQGNEKVLLLSQKWQLSTFDRWILFCQCSFRMHTCCFKHSQLVVSLICSESVFGGLGRI